MTALTQYAKIEASGIWKPGPDDQRREVVVNIGESTLVIASGAGRVLTHWSLPAVRRLNPGWLPALYAPGDEGGETLEIDEELMIASIETVRGTLKRRRPRKGRGRVAAGFAAAAAILLLSIVVLPDILRHHILTVVPDVTRRELGGKVLEEVQRHGGRICGDSTQQNALDRLYRRLLPEGTGRIHILSGRVGMSRHMPGGIIILDRRLAEGFEGPEALAGHVLIEAERAKIEDPLDRLLLDTGIAGTLGLMTSGQVAPRRIAAHAGRLMAATPPPVPVPAEVLLSRFETADVPSTPYALTLDPGEAASALIEGDPVSHGGGEALILDADWVRIQGICAGG